MTLTPFFRVARRHTSSRALAHEQNDGAETSERVIRVASFLFNTNWETVARMATATVEATATAMATATVAAAAAVVVVMEVVTAVVVAVTA